MTDTSTTHGRIGETAGSAQQEGTAFAHSAAGAGQDMAHTAADQASSVAGEATAQAKDLARTARDEVAEQVDSQRLRLARALRTTSDELGTVGDERSALTTELARRTGESAGRVADYLDGHKPADIAADVRRFARKRPGTFLLLAAVAGIAAGRVLRGVTAASSGNDANNGSATKPRATSPDATVTPEEAFPHDSDAFAPYPVAGSDPDLVAVGSATVHGTTSPGSPADLPVEPSRYPPAPPVAAPPVADPYDPYRDQR